MSQLALSVNSDAILREADGLISLQPVTVDEFFEQNREMIARRNNCSICNISHLSNWTNGKCEDCYMITESMN